MHIYIDNARVAKINDKIDVAENPNQSTRAINDFLTL